MREKPKLYILIIHGVMAAISLFALAVEIYTGSLLQWSALNVLKMITFIGWPVIFFLDLRTYLSPDNKQKNDKQP